MNRIHAAITAVGGYVPDKIVTNDDIAQIVDTSDEWIMTRVGIKERRKLEDPSARIFILGNSGRKRYARKTQHRP